MNRLKCLMVGVALTVTISSTTLGGTIIGGRTSRTGTIVGARSGNISGARAGNIAGTSIVLPGERTATRYGFGILLTENIHGVVRLFLEAASLL